MKQSHTHAHDWWDAERRRNKDETLINSQDESSSGQSSVFLLQLHTDNKWTTITERHTLCLENTHTFKAQPKLLHF